MHHGEAARDGGDGGVAHDGEAGRVGGDGGAEHDGEAARDGGERLHSFVTGGAADDRGAVF